MAEDTKTTTTSTPKTTAKTTTAAERAEASRAAATAAKAADAKEPTDDLPPSGAGADVETPQGEIYADDLDPMDDVTDGDPTGMTDPNQFSSSSDPIAEVFMPKTDVEETAAGTEIRPAKVREPVKVRNRDQADAVARTYGVHSGKVGHTVPIVDDYTVVNPREGGLIGGKNGPGAVGRVKAEQQRERAARDLMDALMDGTSAAKEMRDFDAAAQKADKTKYRVTNGSIFTEDGKAVPGQPVYLDDADAKRFSELGRIAPWFD